MALFRYNLRKFLRSGEDAPRQCGITLRQHQLMLGVAGFTGTGRATISELAEFLQEKHNSVVGLIDRAERSGLVRRAEDVTDRRVVQIFLTRQGEEILARLSLLHREQVKRLREGLSSLDMKQGPRQTYGGSAGRRKIDAVNPRRT